MKEKLILAGAGGCMREILWQIEELNRQKETWEVVGYVDKKPHLKNGNRDISVGVNHYAYLGDDDYLLQLQEEANVAICVGEPALRKKIARKLMANPRLRFPSLILGNAILCESSSIGRGCIISMDCRVSTDVTLGDFVFLNMGTMICHDGIIGDYTTLSPDVKLAGNVTIGAESDIGLGSRIIQGITIGNQVVTGAGSVVVKDIEANCIAAGVPAKKIKQG